VYKCSNCEEETTVSRERAHGLYPDPDSQNAPEVVLQEQGWAKGPNGDVYCPGCARGAGR
jgi:hypothetical protein